MAVQGKGSQFEREICVRLSEWVTNGEKKDVFWRTAMSGGRATVFKKRGAIFRQSGDICAVAHEGHALTDEYFFETKFYADLNFPAFFIKAKGPLGEFWTRARDEAKSYGLKPVLIVKQNRMPILWIVKKTHMPKRWLANTRIFQVDVVHLGCTIYRFHDIVTSQYAVPSRIRLG